MPQVLAGEQLEQLLLLRVGAGEAGLDHVDPELVQPVRDPKLLLRGQGHALALHAVAQGRVVQLDPRVIEPRLRRLGRHLHDVEPGGVAWIASVQGVVEHALDRLRDRTRASGADHVVVDLANGHQLGGGSRQEDLVGEVQLGPREVALDDLVAEVRRDRDDRLAADPVEDPAVCGGVMIRRRGPRRCSRRTPHTRSPGSRAGSPPDSRPSSPRSWPARCSGTGLRPSRAGSASHAGSAASSRPSRGSRACLDSSPR